jgi:hypothetical protein
VRIVCFDLSDDQQVTRSKISKSEAGLLYRLQRSAKDSVRTGRVVTVIGVNRGQGKVKRCGTQRSIEMSSCVKESLVAKELG